jgi:hypothetical protein
LEAAVRTVLSGDQLRSAIYLGFAYLAVPEIVSKRLGCQIHHPVYTGPT